MNRPDYLEAFGGQIPDIHIEEVTSIFSMTAPTDLDQILEEDKRVKRTTMTLALPGENIEEEIDKATKDLINAMRHYRAATELTSDSPFIQREISWGSETTVISDPAKEKIYREEKLIPIGENEEEPNIVHDEDFLSPVPLGTVMPQIVKINA